METNTSNMDIDKVKEPESHASGSLVDIEPVYHRGTHDVDEVQENVQNGDLVPEYQDDAAEVDGHVDDVVHQEQEVPSQVPVDLPRRFVRERIPSTRYSSSQYVLLTEGGENMSLMRKLWRVSKRDNGLRNREVPSQVPVDLPRRFVRERIPSTRYSSSQYVLLTEGEKK
nr:Retrovirus-related Pol polyprotein from transposon TNT 1-94 [Ipomoea batatas]